MGLRSHFIAAIGLPILIFTAPLLAFSPAAAQSADTEPLTVLDVLPESTKQWIGRNPEQFLKHTLSLLRKIDTDGDVTYTDIADSELIAFSSVVAKNLGNLLAADLDGDGTITQGEYERHDLTLRRKKPVDFATFAHLVDGNEDGVLSLDELHARAIRMTRDKFKPRGSTPSNPYDLSVFDQNGDGTVTEAELTAMVKEAAALLSEFRKSQAFMGAYCGLPEPPAGAEVVLLSGHKGAGLSSASLAGMDVETDVTTITIEAGDAPLYILAASTGRTIWNVAGAAGRVTHFIAIPPKIPEGTGIGVTGLPSATVSFLRPQSCFKPFNKSDDRGAIRAADRIAKLLDRAPDELTLLSLYGLYAVQVPSGTAKRKGAGSYLGITFTDPNREMGKYRNGRRFEKWRRADEAETEVSEGKPERRLPFGRPVPQVPSAEEKTAATLQEEIEELTEALLKTYPEGVIGIDPATVVSPGKLEPYDVLPLQAGLIQLLRSGALRKTSEKTYTVVREIPRLPAGWDGRTNPLRRIVYGKGVPRPGGTAAGD